MEDFVTSPPQKAQNDPLLATPGRTRNAPARTAQRCTMEAVGEAGYGANRAMQPLRVRPETQRDIIENQFSRILDNPPAPDLLQKMESFHPDQL